MTEEEQNQGEELATSEAVETVEEVAAEEEAPQFDCISCGIHAAEELEGECSTCKAIRGEAEAMTHDQIGAMIRELQRMRNLAVGLGWGERQALGPWDGESSGDERLNKVWLHVAYRINRVINLSIEDVTDATTDIFRRLDLNAILIACASELAKVDTLARANGVPKDIRKRLRKQGLELGYRAERDRYNWAELNDQNASEEYRSRKEAKRKKKKKKAPKATGAPKGRAPRPRPKKRALVRPSKPAQVDLDEPTS